MPAYSFMDVNVTLAGPGVNANLGYGAATAEEGVDIVMAGDKNTMTIGSDGEGMHSLHADKSGEVTIRLLKTSPMNAVLSAAYDFQQLSSASWGQNIITVNQSAAGDIHTARQVAFKKRPDFKYAKDGDVLSWVFAAIKIDGLLGTY